MDVVAGPLQVVALALIVSGIVKLVDPAAAVAAMRSAGLPVGAGPGPGRLVGAVEVASGLALFAAPGRPVAVWLAVLHLALFAFVVRLLHQDPTAGCGCLGRASAPPSRAHAAVNLGAAALAATAAIVGVADPLHALDEPAMVVPYLVAVLTGTGLLLLGPTLLAERTALISRRVPRRFGATG